MVSRSRWLQAGLFLFTVMVMAVAPLRNYLLHPNKMAWPLYTQESPPRYELPHHGNKDYPLWYYTGRLIIEDRSLIGSDGQPRLLYPTEKQVAFPFMYPPFAAILLSPLSLLGPIGMLVALILINAIAFGVVVELSVRMVAGHGDVSIWLRLIPACLSLFFINDMFLLGQPNLGLLALVLGGLMLDRSGRGGCAGILFALAAAIKAFPVVVIVYLVWRRRWKAALSMVLFSIAFFYLVPALVRGFDRTQKELKVWASGMLLSNNEEGIGQRPGLSVSYKNQSIFGLAYRLIGKGPINAEDVLIRDAEEPMRIQLQAIVDSDPDPGKRAAAAERLADFAERWAKGYPEPIYLSPFQLDQKTTQWIAYACCAVLGLIYIRVMPSSVNRTRRTDAAEFGMLIILMTIGTPYAYGYYMVWMIYPLHVVVHEAINNQHARNRGIAWDIVIAVSLLYVLSVPIANNIYPMAYGSFFWASIVLLCGLIWIRYLKRPPSTSCQAEATAAVPVRQQVSPPAVEPQALEVKSVT